MKQYVLGAAVLCACGGGSGTVLFSTWGEDYIEKGIPVDSADEVGFVDGWDVKYDRFLVTIKEITVADKAGVIAFKQAEAKLFDLVKAGPFEIAKTPAVAAQRYDKVSYAMAPAADVVAGNASADDLSFMKTNGYGVYVSATAKKGAVTKTYKWGFALDTLFESCASEEFGGLGVNVPTGATETVQLTVHGDHLYYDDLQSADAKLRFDAIAAADTSPADGQITMDELAAVSLTTLPLGTYGTGGASEVKTLRDFVGALSRTLGHYRGEGECAPKAR